MSRYQERVLKHARSLLESLSQIQHALDFGCGSGWYAREFKTQGLIAEVAGVDVKRREEMFIESTIYDGKTLPFEDRQFELVYAMDVVHHCPSPEASLQEMARCADKYILMKDHVFWNLRQKYLLAALDELGNRKFQIPSPGNYQRAWEWFPGLARAGFRLDTLIHPSPCNGLLLDPVAAPVQFVALWSRH